MTIDQANHRLRMERTGAGLAMRPPRRRVGIMFEGMRAGAADLPLVEGGLRINQVAARIPGRARGDPDGRHPRDGERTRGEGAGAGRAQEIFSGPGALGLEARRNGELTSIHIE